MTLKLSDLPEVSFAEKDINKILTDMISGYEDAYYQQNGVRKILRPGDPIRIFLYSQALRELQLRYLIDSAAKQNLLKYANRDNLINLGAFSQTVPLEPEAATVSMRFNLSMARATDEVILAGTRVSPGGEIYFEVIEDVTVPAGQQSVTMTAKCTQSGISGNGFTPGQIKILVDPIPWISSVENITESSGGIDQEDTESFRNRIHLAPEGFSVAGPSGAYEYFARKFSSRITDVKISSPSDGVVDIRVLLMDGEIPDSTFIGEIQSYLSDRNRRPLTDKVQISGPTQVSYDISVTYYISSENADNEVSVKAAVESAVMEFITWQRSKIGRDVNPSELIYRMRLAGAKRAEVTLPAYTAIDETQIAVPGITTITYGGLENE